MTAYVVTDEADEKRDESGETHDESGETHDDTDERRLECDLCGECVPVAIHREHLLKECSGG